MTFKDKLTEKAESMRIDISDHLNAIKEKMEQAVEARSFTVSLLRAKGRVAIGRHGSCNYQTFIPKGIDESMYMTKFTDAFRELGFSISDGSMSLCATGFKDFDSYDIVLMW